MYGVIYTKQFERALRKLHASGRFKTSAREDLEHVIKSLSEGKPLSVSYSDHHLKGVYKGYRECHIKGDLLLVYEIKKERLILVLVDIGSHSYLF